ncbi:MAG: DUF5320 domain-containing protein [Patescibacteria group bacterium]
MPRLDGTGPEGGGPMTGRGLGNCRQDKDAPTNANNRRGSGLGRGRRGRNMPAK